MALKVRTLTSEEHQAIEHLVHSRTAAARQVERARIVWHSAQGLGVPAIAGKLCISEATVRTWLKRFNARGLSGLEDLSREGRPSTYTPEQVSAVIATALAKPQALGLPFGSWTLDRLQAYLNEEKGILIKRSRIDDLLLAEGLHWRKDETWFGEQATMKLDPDFAVKRGPSKSFTHSHLRIVR